MREARDLGVLVDLGLPPVRDRRCEPRAGDLRDRAVKASGQLLGERVVGCVRPPQRHDLLEVGGGDVDLGVQTLAGAAQPGDLERYHQRVRDRRAGLKATGKRDHRHVLGARGFGELAAGGRDDPPSAERSRGVVYGQRLLGVAGVARAQDRGVRRGPCREGVPASDHDRSGGPVPEGRPGQRPANRRAAHSGHDQPAGGVFGLEVRRLDSPERVAQLIGHSRTSSTCRDASTDSIVSRARSAVALKT